MREKKCNKWSTGLLEVQYSKNNRFHSGINQCPYEVEIAMKEMRKLKMLASSHSGNTFLTNVKSHEKC